MTLGIWSKNVVSRVLTKIKKKLGKVDLRKGANLCLLLQPPEEFHKDILKITSSGWFHQIWILVIYKREHTSRLKIRMTNSPLWWTYLAVVFVHQLPDLSYVSFWIKFFAKNFLYKWDLKFKASSDLICTLIWPQTASKCDTPSSQKLIFKIKIFLHLSIIWISPLWMHFLTQVQWWQRAWQLFSVIRPIMSLLSGIRFFCWIW